MSQKNNHETPGEPVDNPENENGEAEEGVVMSVALTIEEYEALQAEVQKNLDGWQRTQADYNNLRRRTEQERELMRTELTGKVLSPFLDKLDLHGISTPMDLPMLEIRCAAAQGNLADIVT